MVLGALRGEPLVTKVAKLAMYGIFPVAMIAAVIYSPPHYDSSRKPESKPIYSGSSS